MTMEEGHRLVHFDLKGAPPKISYLHELFPLLKKWKVTGLLMEYEDMFPYDGDLAVLSKADAYSKEDILTICDLAAEHGFLIIPLVQTFGHLEFVLKHAEFASLREVPDHCRSICPSQPESVRLINLMVEQVLALHPGLRWFHIGADEVCHIGECELCKRRMEVEGMTKENLFLSHVSSVLTNIKQMSPTTQLIMWDDMFRQIDSHILKGSGLGELVEPMVWHYLPSQIQVDGIWDRYAKVFPNIWVGSAFKGATGIQQYATDITYHLGNHIMWQSVIEKEALKFEHFRGYALTGWQRYDHFTMLCELLPQALPSIGLCLNTVDKGSFTSAVHKEVSSDLKSNGLLPLNPFQLPDIPSCCFPGSDIYVHSLQMLHLDYQLEFTVLAPLRNQSASAVISEGIKESVQRLLDSYQSLQENLTESLSVVFNPNTVNEWLSTYLAPKVSKLKEIC